MRKALILVVGIVVCFVPASSAAFGQWTCDTPREVLLVAARCNEQQIVLDFKATGGAVEGLQRPFTPGSANQIFVVVEDCPDVLTEITKLAQEKDCQIAPGFSGSISVVCEGERNAIIGVVAKVLRIAFSRATEP